MSVEIIRSSGFSFLGGEPVVGELDYLSDHADPEVGHRHRVPLTIAIIEKRPMAGECLSRAICEIEPNYAVYVYSSLQAWHQSPNFSRTSLVLLCASGASSVEAETVEIERELALARQLGAQIPMAVLGDREDANHILKLIELGVRCYISSNLSVYMAVRSIQFAIDGGISIPSNSLLTLLKSQISDPLLNEDDGHSPFTSRETEIIKAIKQGKQNKTIAHELTMSEGTVKVHVRNIMRKLNAKNRTEIAFRVKRIMPSDFAV